MDCSVASSQARSRARGECGFRPLLWTLLLALLPFSAEATEYHLGAQDKLRVKVVEWRADKTEYFNWEVFAGEYSVSASGTVSLPLIGSLPAAGMTSDEFAAAIADTLQKRAGAPSRPEASVEIIQYRPIYVVGSVERPGEYTYRPELTVLQAIGIAGGLYRQTESGLIRLERDRITAAGSHESARLEIRRLLIRRARLTAELSENMQIAVPEELRDNSDVTPLIADEAAIMNARTDALRSQLTANSELRDLFAREVESLEQKIAAHDKQIALARRELKSVGSLVEKGLAVSSREFALERVVTDLENKMLDYTTAALRARQEIRKAERDAADLRSERRAGIVAEIQQTEAALDQAKARLATAQRLIDEATVTAPRLILDRSLQASRGTDFWIVRRTGKDVIKIAVDENAAVQPGDVVHVEQATGDDLSASGLGLSTASSGSNVYTRSGAN
jgi:polysaccharide biosynthesis/export protein ExoF